MSELEPDLFSLGTPRPPAAETERYVELGDGVYVALTSDELAHKLRLEREGAVRALVREIDHRRRLVQHADRLEARIWSLEQELRKIAALAAFFPEQAETVAHEATRIARDALNESETK